MIKMSSVFTLMRDLAMDSQKLWIDTENLYHICA
jgi:hypothetical protein